MRTLTGRALAALAVVFLAACSDRDLTSPDSGLRSTTRRASVVAMRDIRIGVVQAASSVTLGSAADYTVAEKVTGTVLFTGTNGSVSVTAIASLSIIRLQVLCGNAVTVAAKKALAESKGYVTFTEPITGCTRLYVGQLPSGATTAERTAFKNQAIADGIAPSDAFYRSFVISSGGFRVTRSGVTRDIQNPAVVTSSSGRVTIGGVTYRGKGEARLNSSATMTGVNELPVEQYLYGVLPKELGPIAYPEIEAQKAQAVAARTFAVAGFNRRAADGYDLRATTDDQVYGGWSVEHPVSNGAVDATAGLVATYNGALISALYSSASGGHTADNEESFASSPVAYLRGIPDAQRGEALEHVPSLEVFRAHARPTSLRGMKEGDAESDWSKYHRWSFEWTNAEISQVVGNFAHTSVGAVSAINVLERGPSGRVLKLEYVTDAGIFTAEKFTIRSSLTYRGTGNAWTSLPSTLFYLEEVRDPRTKALEGFRVYGGGFGHGVGLSQTGAVGMAEKGATFEEILKQYYQGIELTTWY